MLARLVAALKIPRRVALGVCDRLTSPAVVGILRPCILVPAAALSGWTPEQIEMILLHELAHIRRRDGMINLLQRVVECLLFFHPVVWWLSGRIRLERESCCDQVVVSQTGRSLEYADFIAGVAGAARASLELSIALGKHSIVQRLERILECSVCPVKTTHWVMPVSLLSAIPLLALLSAHVVLPGEKLAPSTPYYRFVDDGGYEGRLQSAIKTFHREDGSEVSLIAYLEAADPAFFEALERRLATYDVVLHGGSTGYPGPEATEGGGFFNAVARVEDHVLTGIIGLVWRGRRLDFTAPRFVHTASRADASALKEDRSGLELLGEDLATFGAYLQARAEAETVKGSFPWSLWEDLQALAGPRRHHAMKWLAAREQTILLNAAAARFRKQAAEDSRPMHARNREILAALRQEIEAGKKKIGLFYPLYLLPELEVHLREELGLKETGGEWLTGWQVGG